MGIRRESADSDLSAQLNPHGVRAFHTRGLPPCLPTIDHMSRLFIHVLGTAEPVTAMPDLSDDCREKLKAIEDDLLKVVHIRFTPDDIRPLNEHLARAFQSVQARRTSTKDDEECNKKLKEIEDDLLMLMRKSASQIQTDIERLLVRVRSLHGRS